MADTTEGKEGWGHTLSRTARVGAVILASLASAFGVLLLINSQAIVGSSHDRNAHDLEIVANAIETWPPTFDQVARLQHGLPRVAEEDGRASRTISHPDFGPIKIVYGACPKAGTAPATPAAQPETARPDPLFPPGRRAGEGPIFTLAGQFVPEDGGDEVCYSTQVAMDRLVGLDRTAELSNIVILGADEAVLLQFGRPLLPITKVPPLVAANSFAKDLAARLKLQTPDQGSQVALATTTGASRARVGDRDYFVYVQPFRVTATAAQCPSADTGRSGGASGTQPAQAPPRVAVDTTIPRPCQLYALGFMPTETLRRAWLKPPPLILLGFGLALFIALALLPAMRLLMIGSTEAVSAAETGAIAFGVYAATSVAALAVLFAIEVVGERALARDEAYAGARELAGQAKSELELFRAAAEACAQTSPTDAQLQAVLDAPAINTAGFVTARGTPETPGVKPWCAREGLPSQSDVSARPYFRELLANPASAEENDPASGPNGTGQVFGQVRSQSDGINKSVVVLRLPGAGDNPAARYFLATTVLRQLVSPVLPPPQQFMVVDTSDPLLPVIFHRDHARVGIDTLASQVQGPSDVAAALTRLRGQPGGGSLDFARRFEGEMTWFSAAGIEGSPWVVLVYHRLDDADAIAAQTATRALAGWASITLPAMAVSVVLLLLFPGIWRYLWPFHDGVPVYRWGIGWLWAGALLIAIVAPIDFSPRVWPGIAIATISVWVAFFVLPSGGWRHPTPGRNGDLTQAMDPTAMKLIVSASLIAIIIVIFFARQPFAAVTIATAGALFVFFRLHRRTLDAEPLTVPDERSYRRFVLAMLVFIGVAPMIAFWADARSLSRELADIRRQDHAVMAIDERFQQIGAFSTVLTRPALAIGGRTIPEAPPFPGDRMNPWDAAAAPARIEGISPGGFSRLLMAWQSPLTLGPINRCLPGGDVETAGRTPAAEMLQWYCWKRSKEGAGAIGVAKRPAAGPLAAPAIGLIVLVALALTALIYAVVYFGLWALTGFGIPLGAVIWPKLVLDGRAHPNKNELTLAAKSLLVAPQKAVRDKVSEASRAQVVNVADLLLPLPDKAFRADTGSLMDLLPPWSGKARLVVSGLELVLRDPERRRVALVYLEHAARLISDPDQVQRNELVVIADMSPLERILDAFDSFGKDHALDADAREELRWARLFQDFTTFSFAPIDKVYEEQVADEIPDRTSAARILVDELRWLPGNVIDGVIVPSGTVGGQMRDVVHFPLPNEVYRDFYTQKIINWAKSADAKTPAAAVDYMRSHLIEFYEQCWVASSLSERVILDAIARNSYVNMRKAVALQSLVRRGLVILDPAPRLMNRSFALYIRQAERPDTLEKWRKQQPRSPWSLARVPLAIVLPVLIIGVTMAAAESGQEVAALVSLLAAGMPALIGSVVRTARGPT